MAKKRTLQKKAAHNIAVKRAHALYRSGDHLTTTQLKLLIKAINNAEPLLSIPAYGTAYFYALQDRVNLIEKLSARKLFGTK